MYKYTYLGRRSFYNNASFKKIDTSRFAFWWSLNIGTIFNNQNFVPIEF